MNIYLRRYFKFIRHYINNPVLKELGEAHHIRPRSLGGHNRKSNIVRLPFHAHFLAHWMLAKSFPTYIYYNMKMNHAFAMMSVITEESSRKYTGRQYKRMAVARKSASSIQLTSQLEEQWQDPVYRDKMSKVSTASNKIRWQDPSYRKIMELHLANLWTPEHRQHISKTQKEIWASDEYRDKMSKKFQAGWQKRVILTCPHCNLQTKNTGNYNRYHGDMCKHI